MKRMVLRIPKLRIRAGDLSEMTYLLMLFLALTEGYIGKVLMNRVAAMIPFGLFTGQTLIYLLFGAAFALNFQRIINGLMRNKAHDVWLLFFLFAGSVIRLYFGPWDEVVTLLDTTITSPLKLLFFYFPMYMVFRSMRDYSILTKRMHYIAYLMLIFLLYVSRIASASIQQGYNTNMTIGYQYGLCALILLDNVLNKVSKGWLRWFNMALSLYSILWVLMSGSRGTFMILLLYFIYRIVESMRTTGVTRTKVLGVLLMVFLLIQGNTLLTMLESVLLRMGVSSRTLAWLLQQDSTLGMSGRDVLYSDGIKALGEHLLAGYGLWGDRLALGAYVHNLFLELLLDFGVFVGGVFTIYIMWGAIKSLFTARTKEIASVVVIFTIGQLMVSSSYLQNSYFFAALGILASSFRTPERKSRLYASRR